MYSIIQKVTDDKLSSLIHSLTYSRTHSLVEHNQENLTRKVDFDLEF